MMPADYWWHWLVANWQVVLAVMVAVYFVPTVVAIFRQHRHLAAIIATNILLGWTFLGWAGALIWSLMDQRKPPREYRIVKREPTYKD